MRFAVGVVVCAGAATRLRLRPNNRRGLFWRGVFGGAAVACYFVAIAHLTVGMATLLNYTSPVFTALFAWLFLDEHIGRRRWARWPSPPSAWPWSSPATRRRGWSRSAAGSWWA